VSTDGDAVTDERAAGGSFRANDLRSAEIELMFDLCGRKIDRLRRTLNLPN
jgi:hypothetical protein